MTTQPVCSVIMTCYNEGSYIGTAVRSVLEQTRADLIDKIVIADDGSAPETITVLRDVEGWDPRIKVLYGPGGKGVAGNRNLADSYCTAPYLAILDGDDIWTPDRLELQIPLLDARPEVGLVYSDFYTFPDQDLSAARIAGVLDITGAEDLARTYFLSDPPVVPSTMLLRRSAFEAAGRFDETIRVFEDTEFCFRISRVCRFALVNKPLMYKRNRSTSITGGRTDLMAHHAHVAFKFATLEPRLLSLVPKRLSERARKLGNFKYVGGDEAGAAAYLGLAVRLNPGNLRAWPNWLLTRFFSKPANVLLGPLLASRRAALRGKTDA